MNHSYLLKIEIDIHRKILIWYAARFLKKEGFRLNRKLFLQYLRTEIMLTGIDPKVIDRKTSDIFYSETSEAEDWVDKTFFPKRKKLESSAAPREGREFSTTNSVTKNSPLPAKEFLTVNDMWPIYRTSRTKVTSLIKEGKLKVLRIGRRILIPRSSIEQWLSECVHKG